MCTILLWCLLARDPRVDQAVLIEKERALLAEHAARGDMPAMGADPFRIRRLAETRFLVLARGADVVMVTDPNGVVVQRLVAPREPIACVLEAEVVTVVGARDHRLARYRRGADRLGEPLFLEVPEVVSPRDLVLDEASGSLILSDAFTGELHRLVLDGERIAHHARMRVGPGPQLLERAPGRLVAVSVLEGLIRIFPMRDGRLDHHPVATIARDGPFWSAAIQRHEDRTLLVAGGIENHPLARTNGGFGHVDSFLTLYDITDRPVELASLNLSALGVVTPKHLSFDAHGILTVAGYGSADLLRLAVTASPPGFSLLARVRAVPGITDLVVSDETLFAVSTLTDRFYAITEKGIDRRSARLGRDERTPASRLGEALLFTTLIAPENASEGGLSRFTCEACHFEGGVDGRVHYTGRDGVHATPKTLRGLAGTVPLFSSGGDDTMAKMVEAELAVANQGDPYFSIARESFPWLADLADFPEVIGPRVLREALLAFLIDFEHLPNPVLEKETRLDEPARAGLAIFRDRCEDCHQAVPTTRGASGVPFDDWDDWLEDPKRDLVWAAPFYYKTGIEPYFDPAGTQVPSLRRIQSRYPYLSDGSARDLDDVLRAFRYRGSEAWHRTEPTRGQPLTDDEITHLKALLEYF